MKRFLAIMMCLVMVLAIVGCKGTKPAEEPAKKVKIGFICLHDEQSTYDLNFINAAKAACEKLGVEMVLKTGINEDNSCYETAADMASSGCIAVFADSFGHEDYMIQAAKEFPNVQFCHSTGTKAHTENLANYHNAFAAIYEGRYLAGVVAGLKLNEMIEAGKFAAEEAKVGYVGAFTYAEVISGYTSFFLGVRSVCPTATMEVTFTGSWYDPTAEKEGAQKLIQGGCKLISQHADSMGAPTACENAGIPNVSYNGSTVDACPNTFIIASRINWVTFMQVMIGRVAKGETLNADWTGNLANGSVEMTALNEKVAAPGTAEKLEEVKAGLIAGSIKVFDTKTFTVGGKELTSYAADVNDLGTFTPDTESIVNGEFAESVFRSAPSFDVDIDGITIIDK